MFNVTFAVWVRVCDPLVAVPATVMVCVPTGVAPVSGPGGLQATIDAPATSIARITRNIGQPLRFRRKRPGMMSSKSTDSSGARSLVNKPESVAALLGALVCTTSVELPLPPVKVAGEKLQVVFAGNWDQLSATGRLKSALDLTVTV